MSRSLEEMMVELGRLAKASPAERDAQAEQLARAGLVPPPPGTFLKAKAQLEALKRQVGGAAPALNTPQPAAPRQPATPQPQAQQPVRQPGVSPAPVVRGGAPQNTNATSELLLQGK